jgi:hypothetical protein
MQYYFSKKLILFFKKTNLILGEKKAWFRVKVTLFFLKSNTIFLKKQALFSDKNKPGVQTKPGLVFGKNKVWF